MKSYWYIFKILCLVWIDNLDLQDRTVPLGSNSLQTRTNTLHNSSMPHYTSLLQDIRNRLPITNGILCSRHNSGQEFFKIWPPTSTHAQRTSLTTTEPFLLVSRASVFSANFSANAEVRASVLTVACPLPQWHCWKKSPIQYIMLSKIIE